MYSTYIEFGIIYRKKYSNNSTVWPIVLEKQCTKIIIMGRNTKWMIRKHNAKFWSQANLDMLFALKKYWNFVRKKFIRKVYFILFIFFLFITISSTFSQFESRNCIFETLIKFKILKHIAFSHLLYKQYFMHT